MSKRKVQVFNPGDEHPDQAEESREDPMKKEKLSNRRCKRRPQKVEQEDRPDPMVGDRDSLSTIEDHGEETREVPMKKEDSSLRRSTRRSKLEGKEDAPNPMVNRRGEEPPKDRKEEEKDEDEKEEGGVQHSLMEDDSEPRNEDIGNEALGVPMENEDDNGDDEGEADDEEEETIDQYFANENYVVPDDDWRQRRNALRASAHVRPHYDMMTVGGMSDPPKMPPGPDMVLVPKQRPPPRTPIVWPTSLGERDDSDEDMSALQEIDPRKDYEEAEKRMQEKIEMKEKNIAKEKLIEDAERLEYIRYSNPIKYEEEMRRIEREIKELEDPDEDLDFEPSDEYPDELPLDYDSPPSSPASNDMSYSYDSVKELVDYSSLPASNKRADHDNSTCHRQSDDVVSSMEDAALNNFMSTPLSLSRCSSVLMGYSQHQVGMEDARNVTGKSPQRNSKSDSPCDYNGEEKLVPLDQFKLEELDTPRGGPEIVKMHTELLQRAFYDNKPRADLVVSSFFGLPTKRQRVSERREVPMYRPAVKRENIPSQVLGNHYGDQYTRGYVPCLSSSMAGAVGEAAEISSTDA